MDHLTCSLGIDVRKRTCAHFLFLSLLAGSALLTGCRGEDKPADFDQLMNVGKAQLENRDSAGAIKTLTAALELRPSSGPARRNLARGQMIARKYEAALKTLAADEPAGSDSPVRVSSG